MRDASPRSRAERGQGEGDMDELQGGARHAFHATATSAVRGEIDAGMRFAVRLTSRRRRAVVAEAAVVRSAPATTTRTK